MKILKQIKRNNRVYYLVEIYKDFAKYRTLKGWYECFDFQDLGLIKKEMKPDRKIRKRRIL